MADLSKIPTLDQLRLMDTSGYPLPGKIVPCLMCTKPFLMRKYTGFPDQVCPECYDTYKDCASIICNRCQVVIAKVKPSVMASGFYVRPKSVLHIAFCAICNPPSDEVKEGDIACIAHVIEVQEYERQFGSGKVIVTMPGTKG